MRIPITVSLRLGTGSDRPTSPAARSAPARQPSATRRGPGRHRCRRRAGHAAVERRCGSRRRSKGLAVQERLDHRRALRRGPGRRTSCRTAKLARPGATAAFRHWWFRRRTSGQPHRSSSSAPKDSSSAKARTRGLQEAEHSLQGAGECQGAAGALPRTNDRGRARQSRRRLRPLSSFIGRTKKDSPRGDVRRRRAAHRHALVNRLKTSPRRLHITHSARRDARRQDESQRPDGRRVSGRLRKAMGGRFHSALMRPSTAGGYVARSVPRTGRRSRRRRDVAVERQLAVIESAQQAEQHDRPEASAARGLQPGVARRRQRREDGQPVQDVPRPRLRERAVSLGPRDALVAARRAA